MRSPSTRWAPADARAGSPAALIAVAGLIMLVMLVLPGCSATRDLLSSLDKPAARVVDARLSGLDAQGLTLDFDVEVDNPYAAPLPVGALDLALSSGGTRFLSAAGQPGASIPAGGSGRVAIPARINFAEALSVLQGVRPGTVIPYRADLGIGVDVPGGERLTLPVAHEGQVPIPAPPTLSVRSLRWDELGLRSARGVLTLDVSNPNEFAAALEGLRYGLSLGGAQVAEASLAQRLNLDAGGSGQLEIPLSFSTTSLGASVIQALASGQISYGLTGDADLGTPFGRVSLPVETTGQAPVTR